MVKKEEGRLVLTKKPKGATVIEGFPGIGVVATITTGFIVEHLKCERIGTYYFTNTAPTISIHDCMVIPPVSIYYSPKYNLAIIHVITPIFGIEWEAAELVLEVCKQLQAKELISIEGIGTTTPQKEPQAFFHTTDQKCYEKMKKIGTQCLREGIIIGVTSALLIKAQRPTTCLFADTKAGMPDSRASAKIIETLDKYLGLKVDYKPLLQQAEKFESKLKNIFEQSVKTKELKEQKELNYLG